MTTMQINAMREFHEETTSVVKVKMTAREMAETPHRLSRSADMATLRDGRVFVWDRRNEWWSWWK